MCRIFAGKNILVGVCGSIAAFKVAGWVSAMAKAEACVTVIMTESAQNFVAPLTFRSLSGRPVMSGMFEDSSPDGMAHIELGQQADLFVIAPATANTIAKLAQGVADDLLTAAALVNRSSVVIFPAMNPAMYDHPSTRKNIATLREFGYTVIEPDVGMMACKSEGKGRLPEWDDAQEIILCHLSDKDLYGKKVLITAGPTREPLDPARFISNRSSGKMGYALARTARRRGAEVILISGPTSIPFPPDVHGFKVVTAADMAEAVFEHAGACDIIVKSAAVSDFRPSDCKKHKVKKGEQPEEPVELVRTIDILEQLGKQKKEGQVLIGFAAETQNHLEYARKKLQKKNLDFIAVNDIASSSTGFETDNNRITLVFQDEVIELPFTSKEHTSDLIWDTVLKKR